MNEDLEKLPYSELKILEKDISKQINGYKSQYNKFPYDISKTVLIKGEIHYYYYYERKPISDVVNKRTEEPLFEDNNTTRCFIQEAETYNNLLERKRKIGFLITGKIFGWSGKIKSIEIWKGTKQQLEKLSILLIVENTFIDSNRKSDLMKFFLFYNGEIQNKIIWKGTQRQLVFLFEQLSKKSLIPKSFLDVEGRGFKIIAEIFLSKDNAALNNIVLANAKSQLSTISTAKGKQKLTDILTIIKKVGDLR